MTIWIASAVVAAVYAAAWAAIIKGGIDHEKRPPDPDYVRAIKTNTKAGRIKYLKACAKLAAQAREELKDGIE